jgi:uncharacterized protein YndB with AHSA1/START domain
MTESSVTHSTFVLERTYDASPSRVFHAFADPAAKARWFSGPEGWETTESKFDFRVGGLEVDRGGPLGGPVHSFEALYQDIVPDRRIVYTYDMHLDDKRISVSLTTIELMPEDKRTRLILTEQGAYLDGHDNPAQREQGTNDLLDALGESLMNEPAR